MSDRYFLALSVVLLILSLIFFYLYFSQLRRRSFSFKNKGKRIWGNAPKVHENLNVTHLDTGNNTACPTTIRSSKNTWASHPISQIAFAVQAVKLDYQPVLPATGNFSADNVITLSVAKNSLFPNVQAFKTLAVSGGETLPFRWPLSCHYGEGAHFPVAKAPLKRPINSARPVTVERKERLPQTNEQPSCKVSFRHGELLFNGEMSEMCLKVLIQELK
ncbi:hypothetical protein [Serratia marcescens]|uniref:hypothetical protein n=2 Tax=Serratia TaxID=613 RepID=UPI0013D90E6C|nr:hypothetical protein [Serratia marcescens]